MKRKGIFGIIAALSAGIAGMMSPKDFSNADPQTQKRAGKSKGGGKRRGFIKGMGRPSPKGTPLGNFFVAAEVLPWEHWEAEKKKLLDLTDLGHKP